MLGTSTGGVGQHVRSLALATGGTVACPTATQAVFGFPVHVPLEIGSRPGLFDLPTIARLRWLARGHDLVHAHGLRAGALAAAAGVGPLVVTWHNAVTGRAGRLLEQLAARRADVTLAASRDLAATARRAARRYRPAQNLIHDWFK